MYEVTSRFVSTFTAVGDTTGGRSVSIEKTNCTWLPPVLTMKCKTCAMIPELLQSEFYNVITDRSCCGLANTYTRQYTRGSQQRDVNLRTKITQHNTML